MDFDLSRLGDKRFEHLTQSLAIKYLGAGTKIFGDGPDGGREAEFEGDFDIQTGAQWVGYGVLQAKYKEHLDGMPHDQTWLLARVRKELKSWANPQSTRKRKPEYLLIATNVRLSGVASTGGLDKLDDLFDEFKSLGIKGHAVWHADTLGRLIENAHDVRKAYADLLLPGDVITRLHEMLQEGEEKIEQAWLAHAGRALRADHAVALGESGDAANTPLELENVAVDLPAHLRTSDDERDKEVDALEAIVGRADNVLAPSLKAAHKNRFVLLGGPGQGKSTLARLICQIYRVGILATHNQAAVVAEVKDAAARMRAAFDEAGLPTPTLNRIPVHISLPVYADLISGGDDTSLLRHMTSVVNKGASDPLSDGEMKKLLRSWPSIVVLDGLDEVSSPNVREDVIERITDFMAEMAGVSADVILISTSRPLGLGLSLPPRYYDYLDLIRLDADRALAYANRFLKVRHPHDPERQAIVAERLSDATQAATTSKLMETPLQVTILALLLERRNRAPSSRYTLFSGYYEVIYEREINKPGWIGGLLEEHKVHINALHENAGLAIHRKAELAGEADSVLSHEELSSIAQALLTNDGWTVAEAASLADKIVEISAERLVLIVPRGDGVGFEVRSLQEFMAARALSSGSDYTIPQRLQVLATSAHWRNTWLLAAGRVFAERPALRAEITGIVDAIDNDSFAALLATPGARLAIDLIDDGLSAAAPMYELRLVNSAMRLLDGPPTREIMRLALLLRQRMDESEQIRHQVELQVDQRAVAGTVPLSTLVFLGRLASAQTGGVAEWARLRRNRLNQAISDEFEDDELDFEASGLSHHYPQAPWPPGIGPNDVHPMKLDPELLAAAKIEDFPLTYKVGGGGLQARLRHSLGSFDKKLTTNPAGLREIVANVVRNFPPKRWREAEIWRNTLMVAIERDETTALLDAVTDEPTT